jgi:hypothetical protein
MHREGRHDLFESEAGCVGKEQRRCREEERRNCMRKKGNILKEKEGYLHTEGRE